MFPKVQRAMWVLLRKGERGVAKGQPENLCRKEAVGDIQVSLEKTVDLSSRTYHQVTLGWHMLWVEWRWASNPELCLLHGTDLINRGFAA